MKENCLPKEYKGFSTAEAPGAVRDFLKGVWKNDMVSIHPKSVLELYGGGHGDVLLATGKTLAEVEQAAISGEGIQLPLADLHSTLNQKTMQALLPHIQWYDLSLTEINKVNTLLETIKDDFEALQ